MTVARKPHSTQKSSIPSRRWTSSWRWRSLEITSAQVPKSVVHGGDGHQEEASPGVAVGAVELVPEFLLRERVLLEEKRAQLFVYDDGDFLIDGPVEALRAAIGLDLQVIGADGRILNRVLPVGVRLRPEFIVDVQQVDLVLPIDPEGGVMMAVELPDFDCGDLQGFGLSECRQRRKRCQKVPSGLARHEGCLVGRFRSVRKDSSIVRPSEAGSFRG